MVVNLKNKDVFSNNKKEFEFPAFPRRLFFESNSTALGTGQSVRRSVGERRVASFSVQTGSILNHL